MKIHKAGRETVAVYIGFGQYEGRNVPLCVGVKAFYSGKNYLVARFWRDITCKHYLKTRENLIKI